MIAASFKRFWPADRLNRLKKLQADSKRAGLRLVARNGGDRTVWLPHLAFWSGDKFVASFWGIDEAAQWLEQRGQ